MLHAACLCRHPAAAHFFFNGLTRNLREWRPSTHPFPLKSVKALPLKNRRGWQGALKNFMTSTSN
jgi:hypothetical protein